MLPGKTVNFCLPIKDLQALPEGASYSEGDGNLRVKAKREGNNLVIAASYDSIPQVVEYYECEENNVIQNTAAYAQETETKKPPNNGIRTAFKWAAAGMIFGIVLLLFILKKSRQWKKVF